METPTVDEQIEQATIIVGVTSKGDTDGEQ
jgi:hypothetical protein